MIGESRLGGMTADINDQKHAKSVKRRKTSKKQTIIARCSTTVRESSLDCSEFIYCSNPVFILSVKS